MKHVIALCLLITSFMVQAQITLGQSAALSGPTQFLGREMKRGAKAYFSGAPEVKLKTKDDKYEPKSCTKNTEKFISENVTALFGYVGTPTSKVAVPIAMSAKKVFFGPFTGAGFLSDATKNPYSFRLRASYDDETKSMVDNLVKKGLKKIAIFVQDDGFGEVGKSGVAKALKAHGLSIHAEGRYKRNTIAVKGGVDKVLASSPDAIILVGAYRPCGTAIKQWKKSGFSGPMINISFVGSKALAKMLKGNASNVYVTQVVPSPWDASIPIVKEYQAAVKKDFGFISLEGYIAAKVFHDALKKAGDGANDSDKLKAAIESLNYDIGGLQVQYGPNDHAGLSKTYITKINDDQSFSYVNSL